MATEKLGTSMAQKQGLQRTASLQDDFFCCLLQDSVLTCVCDFLASQVSRWKKLRFKQNCIARVVAGMLDLHIVQPLFQRLATGWSQWRANGEPMESFHGFVRLPNA